MSGPKTVFEPHIEPQNSPLGPPKVKTTPKLIKNQMSELKETQKIKVVQLHELTPKQLLNPTLTTKSAH